MNEPGGIFLFESRRNTGMITKKEDLEIKK